MRYYPVLLIVFWLVSCQSDKPTHVDMHTHEQATSDTTTQQQQVPVNVRRVELGIPAAAPQEPGKIRPVDEGVRSEGFNNFRSALLHAIARRDTQFIMALVDDETRISFGGEGGKDGFRIMWGLGSTYESSDLWGVLDMLVRMGGMFDPQDPGLFVAPYVYAAWPDEIDAFRHAAITGVNVRVRAEPHLQAEVIASLTYEIVAYTGTRTPEADTVAGMVYPWHEITLDGGQQGWVFGRYVRSPLDFRAGFRRTGDLWKLAFLVAGD